ncbi:MAG: 3-isopropylmalate dehydratase small subunit [Deltaproteobacteria bacterium]|jgi:3-isopropylmalate/(R)-2-methylmalate dehydratase small subunit|nr:3-isopropylmalate dehydratase small subunit [Deltaproteobacteria bacterium]
MQPFKSLTAVAAAYNRPNIDTDLIIPKQFLVSIERTGFGRHLFYNVRFTENGQENPEFFLNQTPNRQARILATGENFGCGSSREHAAWALEDYGFRVILAPSFGDIFRNNAFNCGLVLIELPKETVESLIKLIEAKPGLELTVDLETKLLTGPDGLSIPFDLDEHRRQRLLDGGDTIDLTLKNEEAISAYEKSHNQPWQAVLP